MFRLARETRVPAIRQRAFNSVVVMVLFIFPSVVRQAPFPLRQREVLVLELVRESDVARVL
jgi:hypothetical protein